jgi:GNAT superfamily N-acetyltransferase
MHVSAANLHNPAHQAAIVELLDLYARDPMGGEQPLADEVKAALPERLAALPNCRAFLAWEGELAVGVCIAFLGFSTFQARPLLNLHDVAVRPGHRGGGIGKQLLAAAEAEARRLGCCKLRLEVHSDNLPAQRCYAACGFVAGTPVQEFWTKPL